MPEQAPDGSPFAGPGVDLRGEDARAAIEAAAPIIAWLVLREPDAKVRAISVRTKAPRVLVSIDAEPRPRALRFDPPSANELCDAGRAAERVIEEACMRVLARRR